MATVIITNPSKRVSPVRSQRQVAIVITAVPKLVQALVCVRKADCTRNKGKLYRSQSSSRPPLSLLWIYSLFILKKELCFPCQLPFPSLPEGARQLSPSRLYNRLLKHPPCKASVEGEVHLNPGRPDESHLIGAGFSAMPWFRLALPEMGIAAQHAAARQEPVFSLACEVSATERLEMETHTDRVSFHPLRLLRTIWRVLFVMFLGMSAILVWHIFSAKPQPGSPDRLPVHQTVPDFQLIEQSGQPFARQDLSGTLWVANFVFTRCPGICPLLSARMSKLQTALQDAGRTEVRLVSFSVDPEWDTPERLSSYADKHGADSHRWFFLTGELQAVQQLVTQGFQLSMLNAQRNTPPEGSHTDHEQHRPPEQIVHSDRFVLVDPEFRIRAYYRGNEEELIDHVLHDIELLQHEYKIIR